jgi:hypothetical protein
MTSVERAEADEVGPDEIRASLQDHLEWCVYGSILRPRAGPLIGLIEERLEACLRRFPRDPAEEEQAVAFVCLLVEAFRFLEPCPAENTNVVRIKHLAGRAMPAALALAHRALGPRGRAERPKALEARADLWHLLLEFLAPGEERAALADAAEETLRRAPAGGLSPFQVAGAVALLRGFVDRGTIPAARVAPLVLAALKAWPGPAPVEAGADPLDDLNERTLGTVLSNFFSPCPIAPEGLPEAHWLAMEEVGLGLAGEGARSVPRAEAGINLLYIRGEHLLARGEDPFAGPIGAALRGLCGAEGASPEARALAGRARRNLEGLEELRAGRPAAAPAAAPA